VSRQFSRAAVQKATWEKNVFVRRQMESKHLAAKLKNQLPPNGEPTME